MLESAAMRFTPLPALALLLAGCASAPLPIPPAWTALAPAGASALAAHREASDIAVVTGAEGTKIVRGTKELTPAFAAVDSYDVSLERGEVVFSAKRTDNFDVGLVSTDGSDIHWLFPDKADEIQVAWASRGNKFAFVARTPSGDVIRTVHVPTATHLTVEFPWSEVRAFAWNAAGDRYAVAVSGLDASERVESMKYGGEERRLETPAAIRLDVATEPFSGGVLLRPATMRYGQLVPLVVWISDSLAWNDARGALLRDGQVACAVVRHPPDAAFWAEVGRTRWIDPARMYVVGARSNERDVISIVPSAAVPAGTYRLEGRVLSAPPAVVQSVAAGFIAERLKGTGPRNGSR
jgi:hypothetical protein